MQQGVAKAGGERQVGRDVPGILGVPIELPGTEILGDQSALRNLHILRGAIVLGGHDGNQAENVDGGDVVGRGVVGIDFREAKGPWIEAAAAACGSTREPERVGGGKGDVGGIGGAHVADVPDIGAELERVAALGPSQIIDDVVDGDVEFCGERS